MMTIRAFTTWLKIARIWWYGVRSKYFQGEIALSDPELPLLIIDVYPDNSMIPKMPCAQVELDRKYESSVDATRQDIFSKDRVTGRNAFLKLIILAGLNVSD